MELLELVGYEPATRPFQCDWNSCTKSFTRKYDLQRHYRIHTNERPYSCSIPGCGKSFIQRNGLTTHIRTHTGEKPHQCQHMNCGERFSDSASLCRHRRVHIGKRTYRCDHGCCTKRLSRKSTMAKHQRRSHPRDLQPCRTVDDCSASADTDERLPSPPQTANPWPMSAVVPGHPKPQSNVYRAASFPDFRQQRHQFNTQNAEDCSFQQPFYVAETDYIVATSTSGIDTMGINIQPPSQVSRSLEPANDDQKRAYFTQRMTRLSSCPEILPTTHQSPPYYNFYAIDSPEGLQAMYTALSIQQQSMGRDIRQVFQQIQSSAEYYPSPQAEAEQIRTIDPPDIAFQVYGEVSNQAAGCVVKSEGETLYGRNMDATTAEDCLVTQTVMYGSTWMQDTPILPTPPHTSQSVASLDLYLADGAQHLVDYGAPPNKWNGDLMPTAMCY